MSPHLVANSGIQVTLGYHYSIARESIAISQISNVLMLRYFKYFENGNFAQKLNGYLHEYHLLNIYGI